jgi:hypothetical protein
MDAGVKGVVVVGVVGGHGGGCAGVGRPARRQRQLVTLRSVMKWVLSWLVSRFVGAGIGAAGSTGKGQAVAHMGFEPDLISGRPCDLSGCASSADP